MERKEVNSDKLTKTEEKKIHETIGSCMEINAFNGSTFACDSLLVDNPYNVKSRIRFIEYPESQRYREKTRQKIGRKHCLP